MSEAPATRALPTREPALDGLRGIAVLLVFLFHYGGGLKSHLWPVRLLGYVSAAGWTGVVLFFALSGFLITGSLWESRHRPHRLRNFYLRRALRIGPLYYCALLLSVAVSLALGLRLDQLRASAIYALLLDDLPRLISQAQRMPAALPLYHLWSVAVEEQFYLLWPLLLFRMQSIRSVAWLSVAVFLASFAFRAVFFTMHPLTTVLLTDWAYSPFTHAGSLALGALLAMLVRSPVKLPSQLARMAAGASLACFFLAERLGHTFLLLTRPMFLLGLPAAGLCATSVLLLALRPGLVQTLCRQSTLRRLGTLSFGFYVFQTLLQPLIDLVALHLTQRTGGSWYLGCRLVVAFCLAWLAAALSYRFLEQPFLRLKARIPMRSPLDDGRV